MTFPRHRATIPGAELVLNERQRALLQSLKPGERITPASYLATVASQVQERQARTDLIALSHAGYLQTLGRGRSTSYRRTDKSLP